MEALFHGTAIIFNLEKWPLTPCSISCTEETTKSQVKPKDFLLILLEEYIYRWSVFSKKPDIPAVFTSTI